MKHALIVNKLAALPTNDQTRMELLVAAIAFSLDLPKPDIDNVTQFYIHNCQTAVNTLLTEVNEELMIPLQEAISLTRKVYLRRVNMAYWPMALSAQPFKWNKGLDFSDVTVYGQYVELCGLVTAQLGKTLPSYPERRVGLEY